MKPVWVSDHVLERLAERHPGTLGLDEDVIAAEVAESIEQLRYARRKPRSITREPGRRPRAAVKAGRPRFVWTAAADRVYLVKDVTRTSGERGVLVVTVYTPLVGGRL